MTGNSKANAKISMLFGLVIIVSAKFVPAQSFPELPENYLSFVQAASVRSGLESPVTVAAPEAISNSSGPLALSPQGVVENAAIPVLPSVPTQGCRVIDGREIGCCAARKWMPSQVLRQRGRAIVEMYCDAKDECERQAAYDLNHFLVLQSKHQEDIGAASALRAYYTRISLTEQLALTQDFLARVQTEESKQNAAQEGGLPAGTDLSSFGRSRIEILDKQLQVLSKDRQLRCLISELTGYDYGMYEICAERLTIHPVTIDCPTLKQIGLATRKDLRGWVFIAGRVNETSAPIFARMLGTLIGGWGMPLPKVCGLKYLLCPPDYATLARNLKHELELTAETHRRWICQAIEEKCENLKLAYQRIDLANQTIASWEDRIAQLQRLEEQGESEPAQLADARKELLLARSEEINRRLDARIAEVEVAEAIGGISDRCCAGEAWLRIGW